MSNGNKKLTNLYVKNFDQDFNETKLCQLFSAFGTITSCKIQMDNNGQSKGFGFVNFERPDMAQKAMENLNGYRLNNNKRLYVGLFQRKSERQQELGRMQEEIHEKRSNQLCLYISNLDTMIDEKYLEEIFSRFGEITKTHILRHGSQSKGVGFVCFNTVEEATRAVNEMNGQWVLSKPIYVKFSNDTDEAKLATSTSRSSSLNSFSNTAHSSVMPMLPYPNHPTIFFVPTMIVPPVLHRFPQQTKQYTLSPSSPPTMIAPTITNTTTTAEVKRQPYPYTSVKSDD